MRPTFDVFTVSPDGQPLWIESIESLKDARERLRELARNVPQDCFIYSEENGVVELLIHSDLQDCHTTARPPRTKKAS
jgi:hypothetical protein